MNWKTARLKETKHWMQAIFFKQEVRDVQQSFRFPASAAANREQA